MGSIEAAQLKAAGVDLSCDKDESKPSAPLSASERQRAEQRAQRRAKRLENYEQAHALRKQGYKLKDIAHHLDMGERTVWTYLSHPTFPEWQPTTRRGPQGSILDPYKPYLIDQWRKGNRQSKRLFEEIRRHGYQGSYPTLARFTKQLPPLPETLHQLPGKGPAPAVKTDSHKSLNASRAAWLVLQRPETLSDEQKPVLELLREQPELSPMLKLAQDFMDIVRQRLPDSLDDWLKKAQSSTIKAFQSFAKGLDDDYDAVKAGVTLDVSNGQVEGQNNRLKMLKRQMFGRAGLDLLAKRLILSAP